MVKIDRAASPVDMQGDALTDPANHTDARPLAMARRAQIAELLRQTGSITVAELERRYGISAMTARRDLEHLARKGRARRTHGGAVLPEIARHEDSFGARLQRDTGAKQALAGAAFGLLAPNKSVFLDSSSTTYVLAQRIARSGIPLTVITNSLPIMELIAATGSDDIALVGIGGTLRRITRSYVGPLAVQTVRAHFADQLFLSVKGITSDGVLTDADALEAEVKRAMIAHTELPVLLLNHSKLVSRGLSAIEPIDCLSTVVIHGLDSHQRSRLRARGIDVVDARVVDVEQEPKAWRGSYFAT